MLSNDFFIKAGLIIVFLGFGALMDFRHRKVPNWSFVLFWFFSFALVCVLNGVELGFWFLVVCLILLGLLKWVWVDWAGFGFGDLAFFVPVFVLLPSISFLVVFYSFLPLVLKMRLQPDKVSEPFLVFVLFGFCVALLLSILKM